MKLTRIASGKVKISRKDWRSMGLRSGWLKKAQGMTPEEQNIEQQFMAWAYQNFGTAGTKLTQEQVDTMQQKAQQMGLDWLDVAPVQGPDSQWVME